jgi:hypothetical protein
VGEEELNCRRLSPVDAALKWASSRLREVSSAATTASSCISRRRTDSAESGGSSVGEEGLAIKPKPAGPRRTRHAASVPSHPVLTMPSSRRSADTELAGLPSLALRG